jgi:nucleotide-binding universal stress UspA family protein
MFDNILIGIDGSEHSYKAANTAGELARKIGSQNMCVVVCYDPMLTIMGSPLREEEVSTRIIGAEKKLKRALQEIGDFAGDLKTEVLEGPAAEAILSIAEVRGIDLIIMGTRGEGQLAGLLLGSQSQKVVSHAKCPVLMVH